MVELKYQNKTDRCILFCIVNILIFPLFKTMKFQIFTVDSFHLIGTHMLLLSYYFQALVIYTQILMKTKMTEDIFSNITFGYEHLKEKSVKAIRSLI